MPGEPRNPLPLLALSRVDVDRAAWNRTSTAALDDPGARVLDVVGARLAVDDEGRLLVRGPGPDDGAHLRIYLGEDADGAHHVAVVRPEPHEGVDTPTAASLAGLRQIGQRLDAADAGLATTAVAMAEWHAATRFCARCGGALAAENGGWLLRCADGHDSYPAVSPAVIMAVVDDADRILLARGPRWKEPSRSVLAGFVEPGESLEATVAREVREEVGIDVTDIRYEGNQPWPFPASLMLAFSCRARSTDLRLDPDEIAEAQWYTREELDRAAAQGRVSLPSPLSVAHHLVAQWYGGSPPGARAV